MEESEFIQDLLECSVCLEQLTDQSKVLPCQHTFCRKCLAEIIQTRNELQCPECRIIVDITDLDELPSNILLIRLLEGLKQNMRIKNNKIAKTPIQTPLKQSIDFESKQNLMKNSQKSLFKKHSSVDSPESLKNLGLKPKIVSNFDNRRPVILPNSIIAQQLYRHQYLVNSDKTLVKQPILNESAIFKNQVFSSPMTMNSVRQNNSSNINPTSSYSAELITNDNQEFPKKIMTNAKALYDSDFNSHWRIKKNDIIYIHEQINFHYYIAFFENTKGLVPVSFVELLPKLPKLPKQNANCKNSSDMNCSESRQQNNLAFPSNNSLDSSEQQMIQSSKLKKQVPYANNSCYQDQTINLGVNLSISDHHSQPIICKALYDFRVAEVNEKNCLSFKKNDLITLIRRVDDNWLEGSLKKNIGIFPISFVELLPIIKPSSRSSSQNDFNTHPHLTQVATTYQNYSQVSNSNWNSNSNLVNMSHSRNNSMNQAQMNNLKILNSSKNENTRNETMIPNEVNSNKHLKNSSDSSQRINVLNKNLCSDFSKNPNSSLPLSYQLGNANLNKSSVMISGSTSSNSYDNLLDIKSDHQRNLYIALYNYKPQKVDELELRKNEYYLVHEKCLDGWFKGSCTKSKKSGVFPGNYVQLVNDTSDSSYQNVIANRRSFGNLSNLKFDSSNNLFNETLNDYDANRKNNVDSEISSNMSKMIINKNLNDQLFYTQNHLSLSKSVEQINKKSNDNKNKKTSSNKKESTSNNSSTNNSPQWHQPKVAATRSCKNDQYSRNINDPPYPLIFDELNDELRVEVRKTKYNTTHIIKEIINTPLKKEEKKVNLIKMFTGKRFNSKTEKSSNKNSSFSCDNPTFVDISPKN